MIPPDFDDEDADGGNASSDEEFIFGWSDDDEEGGGERAVGSASRPASATAAAPQVVDLEEVTFQATWTEAVMSANCMQLAVVRTHRAAAHALTSTS